MTISIEIKNSNKIHAAKSAFVRFPYNLTFVEKIKSLPKRFYTPAEKSWEIPVESLNNVIELFSDEEIKLTGPVISTTVVEEEKTIEIEHVEIPIAKYDFKTQPFQHQIEAFEYAMKNPKFLLGDEQGLGKTKQSIDIAVARKSQFKHVLIVCGVNGLKHNWAREIKTHSNESAHILGQRLVKGKMKEGSVKKRLEDLNGSIKDYFLITNIETLRDKDIQGRLEEMTKSGTIGMVIIDEIHKCKNAQSKQGKAIHCLKSKYKLALTGTPLMNQPLDLYNVLKWLEIEKHSFYQFKNFHCVMGGYGGHEVVGYKNLDQLRSNVKRVMLRRKKVEVLNLPPKIRQIEYVEMTAKQSQLYGEVRASIEANLSEIALNPNPLATLIRLRQVTGHPAILSNSITESAKIERLKEIIEELVENNQKAIIFSNWTEMTDVIRKELTQYNPAVITGQIKNEERDDQSQRFQNDPNCHVIVGTIGAMGTGLTLTAASTVIFLDKPWNMANTEQAEDRAHRIGTKSTVNVITLVCKDTIDERIEEIIEEKSEMADALIEGNFEKLDKMQLMTQLLS